jgi:hypothetical protein
VAPTSSCQEAQRQISGSSPTAPATMRSPALLLLCASAALLLAAAAAAAEQGGAKAAADNMFGGKNVLLFLSDQVRA